MPKKRDPSSALEAWYSSIYTRRVDLVGDYAGAERFVIEGESLLLQAFSDPLLDFGATGFQLLHAAYNVEKFLKQLHTRGCNFHIAFFDDQPELCIPDGVNTKHRAKYLLARAAIIRHLRRNVKESLTKICSFRGIEHPTFLKYLHDAGCYFVLCHDGTGAAQNGHAQFRWMMHWLAQKGWNVALLNGLECQDTKILTTVLESKQVAKMLRRPVAAGLIAMEHLNIDDEEDDEEDDDNLSGDESESVDAAEIVSDDIDTLYDDDDTISESSDDVLEADGSDREELGSSASEYISSSEDEGDSSEDEVESNDDSDTLLDVADDDHHFHTLLAIAAVDEIDLSEREVLTILVGQKLLAQGRAADSDVSKLLLHTAALQYLPLTARHLSNIRTKSPVLDRFADSILRLLRNHDFSAALEGKGLKCDVADLIDGRLWGALLHQKEKHFAYLYYEKGPIQKHWSKLGSILTKLCEKVTPHQPFQFQLKTQQYLATTKQQPSVAKQNKGQVLPFSHPVLDRHLAPIHLATDDQAFDARIPVYIFSELSHWHNANRPLVIKGQQIQKMGFWAHKRNQKFMTEVRDYAASLTNAVGKVLDPEVIVVKEKQSGKARPKHAIEAKQKKESGKGKQRSTTKGKEAALASAAKAQQTRDERDERNYLNAWDAKCKELGKVKSADQRYVVADRYYQSLQRPAQAVIQSEVTLFKILCLHEAAQGSSEGSTERSRVVGYIALIWESATSAASQKLIMHLTVAKAINELLEHVQLSRLEFVSVDTSRRLPFKVPNFSKASLSGALIQEDSINFQLTYCGPYLDRSFDSKSDSRVPFQPDAWQREVLDAIDATKSLLVLAPTSSGKTFISFYAMKQVLEASDDGILVYVAPTKALVNQIAAEVQARFSKNLKRDGRSVWGIHTRDYRINNPTGCQVLVTVPHILQIMLLSPNHAKNSNSWSNRVKRIIFDEVHCIGQAEDGLIWEQLLLLAPCPIIALSATVGNPEALGSWLESTQQALGNELVVVQHKTRYSDLRKYIYNRRSSFEFTPIKKSEKIHIPGLEGCKSFEPVHPASSLIDRARGIPEDLSLEPKDCLVLHQLLSKYQTKEHPVPKSLHPRKAMPDVVRKVDVLTWEQQLKTVLKSWMDDASSPFDAVMSDLAGHCQDLTDGSPSVNGQFVATGSINREILQGTLPLLFDLNSQDALPAIIFNFDRGHCEKIANAVTEQLIATENVFKKGTAWQKKMKEFEDWKVIEEKARQLRAKSLLSQSKVKVKGKDKDNNEDGGSKLDRTLDSSTDSSHPFARFDPGLPLDGYHFADEKRLNNEEFEAYCKELQYRGISKALLAALRRGIGVHHAGMNRKYRQIVEILFRKGFLRVVVATGTLALGINMPCKTVVFSGDSIFLTALNFRQAAGRAGRRGFDVLGNVVFHGIPQNKVHRLLSSRLPDLNGHFPITTSLVLRLFTLLHETKNSNYATKAVNALLSQPRLYLGGQEAKMTVLHHLRFSIEYLRRQSLLGANGEPLNLAGLVSHLYYTENSGFAFHSLLKGGYFHGLCKNIYRNRRKTLRELMLTLSHLFARLPWQDLGEKFTREVIKPSPSIVLLPGLPNAARKILQKDTVEILQIYSNYVSTFVDQHVHEPEDKLPFSSVMLGSLPGERLPSTPTAGAKLRSSFVALSGHGDKFLSIHDLCTTVRDGVFLEEHVIPYIDISSEGHVLNAYIYDFYKHGDVTSLWKANRIRRSDVWFKLNDFSMILATIIASMKNFMGMKSDDDVDLDEVRGSGDVADELAGEADEGDDIDGEPTQRTAWATESDKGMVKVLVAFEMLRKDFDEKFKAMWA